MPDHISAQALLFSFLLFHCIRPPEYVKKNHLAGHYVPLLQGYSSDTPETGDVFRGNAKLCQHRAQRYAARPR